MNFEQLYPDERDKAETRIKQCHSVLLRMFKIVKYLCEKHNIEYFLCSGTLKAAILYKGFKPWDDDFDVGMTRNNYEKFVKCAVPELPNDIFFQTPETDIFFPACHVVEAKLRDKYSSYVTSHDSPVKWHNGLMLDILVFDCAYLPHNYFIFITNGLLKILFKYNIGNDGRAKVLKWISSNQNLPLVYASSYISTFNTVIKGTNYFTRNEIETLIHVKFEGIDVPIPKGWESYLTRRYGNFANPITAALKKGHHGIAVPNPFTPCSHSQVLLWKNRSSI